MTPLAAVVIGLGAAVFVGAVVLAARRGQLTRGAGAGLGGFLCDRCRYDDVRTCARPERPNATACPDFKSRR